MGMLQVKNLPDELHAALADRARSEGTTMSEYVTRLIQRDLARPTIAEWVAEQRSTPGRIDIDAAMTITAVRAEYDAADDADPAAAQPATPRSR